MRGTWLKGSGKAGLYNARRTVLGLGLGAEPSTAGCPSLALLVAVRSPRPRLRSSWLLGLGCMKARVPSWLLWVGVGRPVVSSRSGRVVGTLVPLVRA